MTESGIPETRDCGITICILPFRVNCAGPGSAWDKLSPVSLTLQLADSEGHLLQESFVVLDDELLEYLSSLDGFPVLGGFRDFDPSADTPVDAAVREALGREVAELAARARRREVPEPPAWVGLEGLNDIRLGEEFGWKGLLVLLQRIEHLLHLARTLEMEVWALGE